MSGPSASIAGSTNHLESYLGVAMSSASSRIVGCDHDEALTPNLSLDLGSYSYRENVEQKGHESVKEIDLELRLGRNP